MNSSIAQAAHAIAAWFDNTQLIGLGEAHHVPCVLQTLTALIEHGALGEHCQDIVVEFGCSSHQSLMDAYLSGATLSAADLTPVLQDSHLHALWSDPVYMTFFQRIRTLNQQRTNTQQIRIWLAEPPLTQQCPITRDQRESIQAERATAFFTLIKQRLLDQQRQGMLIFGMRHLSNTPINRRESLGSRLLQHGARLRTVWPELPPRFSPFPQIAETVQLMPSEGDTANVLVAPWGGEPLPVGALCDAVLRVPGSYRESRCPDMLGSD